jgi:hypothetical protein
MNSVPTTAQSRGKLSGAMRKTASFDFCLFPVNVIVTVCLTSYAIPLKSKKMPEGSASRISHCNLLASGRGIQFARVPVSSIRGKLSKFPSRLLTVVA